MTKSSALKALLLLLEAPICMGAAKKLFGLAGKLLRPRPAPRPTQAPIDPRHYSSFSETIFSTPTETTKLQLGYDKDVGDDGMERLVLSDVTRYTTRGNTSTTRKEPDHIAVDVMLSRAVLKQIEDDDLDGTDAFQKRSALGVYGKELMQKSRDSRLQKIHCEADDFMSLWAFHPGGRRKQSVTWTVSLKLEMEDPQQGFKITELSSSFGRNYDPKLSLKFNMGRLRQLEERARTILPESGANLTSKYLTKVCKRQIREYVASLSKTSALDLKGIVIRLLGGSFETAPEDLQYEPTSDKHLKPHHQLTIVARTPSTQERSDEAAQ